MKRFLLNCEEVNVNCMGYGKVHEGTAESSKVCNRLEDTLRNVHLDE